MSTPADDLRQKAEECERLAEQATDPARKKQYEVMARQWRAMLERAEQGVTKPKQ
jgi:hypothetical protein